MASKHDHATLVAILERVAPEKMAIARRERAEAVRGRKGAERGMAELRSNRDVPPWLGAALTRVELRSVVDGWRSDTRSFGETEEAIARRKLQALSKRELDGLRMALVRWLPDRSLRDRLSRAGAQKKPPSVELALAILRCSDARIAAL
jgi:hypothetical protein